MQQFPFTLRPLCPQHTSSLYFFICRPYWKTTQFLHLYVYFQQVFQNFLISNQYSLRKNKKCNAIKNVTSATLRNVRNILRRNSFISLPYHSLCGPNLLSSLTINKVHKIMIGSSIRGDRGHLAAGATWPPLSVRCLKPLNEFI